VRDKGEVENEITENERKRMKIGPETKIEESWKMIFPTFSKENNFLPMGKMIFS